MVSAAVIGNNVDTFSNLNIGFGFQGLDLTIVYLVTLALVFLFCMLWIHVRHI